MTLARRIIPCLDVTDGRVVKGTQFEDLRDAGDPIELARFYDGAGADELVFLDITATRNKTELLVNLIERLSHDVFIPLTLGGGIDSEHIITPLLRAGADKVSINSAAVKDPDLLGRAANRFGSQCIVLAIDARKREDGTWEVCTRGGSKPTGRDVLMWAREGVARGAGEILLTSMDNDGTRTGFDVDLTKAVSDAVSVPVIASGGAGKCEHFVDVFKQTAATAALAASIFHFKETSITRVKKWCMEAGIVMRPPVGLEDEVGADGTPRKRGNTNITQR